MLMLVGPGIESENLDNYWLGGLLINMEVSSYNLSTVISDCLLMHKEGKLVPLSQARQARVAYIRFTTLTQEEVEKMSILEITEKAVYRGGQPVRGGVNDLRMGVGEPGQTCETCGKSKDCQGHFGHIKLAAPVFNIGYVHLVDLILRCICHNCGKIKTLTSEDQQLKMMKIATIAAPTKRLRAIASLLGPVSKCGQTENGGEIVGCGCFIPVKIMIREKVRVFVELRSRREQPVECEYDAKKVRSIFNKIDSDGRKLLGFTYSKPSDFFIEALVVCPPQVRTAVELGPEKSAEDDITESYRKVVDLNNQIKKGLQGYKRLLFQLEIQKVIAAMTVKLDKQYLPSLDSKNMNKKKVNPKSVKSIQERLTSKEGRFRQNLMGKRVNFSARTVISPDSQLDLDEVGVPQRIAAKLTVPEVIYEFNLERITRLCKEGKVEFLTQPQVGKKQGNFLFFNQIPEEDLPRHLTYGTVVERHLEDGDYVLFNRQPTLHRMSMMGHRVRILPYSTFRLNLSVCSPYNADFDGDEMNLHAPQSVEAFTELKHLASVTNQVISPKNGAPVMGVVQDTLLGIYLISDRDSLFTKEEMVEMLSWVEGFQDRFSIEFPMPCILRPQPLWSGKQLMSFFLPKSLNIAYLASQNSRRNLDDRSGLLIRQGQLITGSLAREQVGPGSGKIIHSIWVEMGPEATHRFIMNMQRLAENWLMQKGFSVGAADILIDRELERLRDEELNKIREDYFKNIHMFRNLPRFINENLHQKGKKVEDSLEFKINLDLNNSLSRVQKIVASKVSVHHNNIYKMIAPRSKGSQTNLAQIVCCLGNQNVDGKRCPQGFEGRALPHFSKQDNSPQPRGFVFSSFFRGLKPHEFFFHSMAGREGLSDTAVKTSSIGYLQRKLIKALEDLSIRYDGTVRDCHGNVYQRCYGEDGFLPEYIEMHKFNEVKMGQKQYLARFTWGENWIRSRDYNPKEIQLFRSQEKHLIEVRQLLRKVHQGSLGTEDITYHCPVNVLRILRSSLRGGTDSPCDLDPTRAIQLVNNLLDHCHLPRSKSKDFNRYSSHPGQDSEMLILRAHLRIWLCSVRVCRDFRLKEETLVEVCNVIRERFMQAIAPAGEPVGCLAAQSIGEPTTQMTLNTFHLAGVSDKNVTLGIPRLRELLDISKNIKTPLMTVYFHRRLLWENKHEKETLKAQRIMLSELPYRCVKDLLVSTRIYYDSGQFMSNINGEEIEDRKRARKTPWVLILKFDFEKLIAGEMYEKVCRCLRDKFGRQFEIENSKGISAATDPEIEMRLTSEGTSRLGQRNLFQHVKQREIDVKNLFLSGLRGIKSVKTARRVKYAYRAEDEVNMSLDNRTDELVFDVVGSNLRECLRNPYIDASRTGSNNLSEVEEMLGIEATRQCLLDEIREVLKPYSIYINHRHLAVLADWMTARGRLIPVNRFGINRVKDVSLLRKASFEETMDVLFSAAAFSEADALKGVSERIIFGQKLKLGTNACQVTVDIQKVQHFAYQPLSPPSPQYPPQLEATPQRTPTHTFLSSASICPNPSIDFRYSSPRSPNYKSRSPTYRSGSPDYRSSSPAFSDMGRLGGEWESGSPGYHPSQYISSRSPSYNRAEEQVDRPQEDLYLSENDEEDDQ